MRISALTLGMLIALGFSGSVLAQGNAIKKDEIEYQKQNFKQWWGTELIVKFDDLPTVGVVPKHRVPYSGHDYPDRGGGTLRAMAKYDRAFSNGRRLATQYEARDVRANPRAMRGLDSNVGRRFVGFGGLFRGRVPGWYGHCNGWTAAAIRHAEPQRSVTRNGVVFTPADIKGMLAEIYMYTDTEFLGGVDSVIHPATFHLTITNWLGRGSHPVGMEATPGTVAFNYPIYSYRSTIKKISDKQIDVKTSVRFATSTPHEVNKSPRQNQLKFFHYSLTLDDDGNITGGRYYGDSARIDMLWAPLQPIQGGEKGNKLGNPHVNVKEVLAIWRESVDPELRNKWFNIDPPEEDRIGAEDEKPVEAKPTPKDPAATPKEADKKE